MVTRFKIGDKVRMNRPFLKQFEKNHNFWLDSFVKDMIKSEFKGVVVGFEEENIQVKLEKMTDSFFWNFRASEIERISKIKKVKIKW